MNIAIPVSNHDKHLLPTFVKVLQHFGGLEEASLCFFTTPSAKAEAHEAAAALNAAVHTFEVDFAGGWPVASGAQFAATVFTIPNIGWNGPWLWMELDMLPVKRGWVQVIRNGYTLCGSPFMGNVVPTAWVEEGKLVVKEDDLMMMGCGVYPANMDRDQRFRPLLSDLVKPADRNPHTPFDFYLRHAMSQAGIANTTLIADMWQTHEYKRTGKGITCKPVPLDKPRRERGGLVPSDAVLVHGCKDGTLAELLLSVAEKVIKDSGGVVSYAKDGSLNCTPGCTQMLVAGSIAALSANPEKAPLLEKMLEVNLLPTAAEVVNQLKQGDADPAKRLPLPLVAYIAEQALEAPAAPATLFGDDTQQRQAAAALVAGEPPHTEESLNAPRPPTATGTFTLPPTPEVGYSILPAPTVTDANGTHTPDVAILKQKPTRTAVVPWAAPRKAEEVILTADEFERLTHAIEAPPAPPPAAVVEAVQLHQSTVAESATGSVLYNPPSETTTGSEPAGTPTLTTDATKQKPMRTAVESLRKSKKGVAVEIARALGVTIGDFAKLLPELGYVIVKGGKLQSTK